MVPRTALGRAAVRLDRDVWGRLAVVLPAFERQALARRSARRELCRAARAIARVRGATHHHHDEALAIWRALCAGGWTLLDRFDLGGRRFLVVRESAPCVSDPRALTIREQQVLAFAVIGHTNKLVAYALGISPSTVASHLKSAMTKLGVRSRLELIETYAELSGQSAAQEV